VLPCRKWRVAVCMCQMNGVELTKREPLPSVPCLRVVALGTRCWRCGLVTCHGVACFKAWRQILAVNRAVLGCVFLIDAGILSSRNEKGLTISRRQMQATCRYVDVRQCTSFSQSSCRARCVLRTPLHCLICGVKCLVMVQEELERSQGATRSDSCTIDRTVSTRLR
jgi:hypothetical protein